MKKGLIPIPRIAQSIHFLRGEKAIGFEPPSLRTFGITNCDTKSPISLTDNSNMKALGKRGATLETNRELARKFAERDKTARYRTGNHR